MAVERNNMNTLVAPPRLATTMLAAFLRPRDFETISGDILEQYRDSIYPSRGRRGADLWYTAQVLTFLPSLAVLFAVLFSAQFLARTMFDLLIPTADFHVRAIVSTALGTGLLLAASLWASWRSNSLAAGVVVGVLIGGMAAVISIAGAALLLAIWHDPQTKADIEASGGVGELFTLPLAMAIPAVILGTVGGGISVGVKRMLG
jgi:hypothetical protein